MLVVSSDKGCQSTFIVRNGRRDNTVVFGVLACGAVPGAGA